MDASIDSGAVAGAGEGAGVVAVTPPAPPPASEVISAVRAGDAHGVEALLSAGADPDARDEHGTPVLCLAIETYAVEVVRLLATHGADPDRCGPDGVRPLRKAVDSGSPAVAGATVHNTAEWRRHREAELLEARSLARHWYETGVEAELRRRTGAQGAVARTHVQDDEYTGVDEFSLGGATVRDGHAAILTDLEKVLGLRPPFEELLERALTRPDQRHATWAASPLLLSHRRDQETWDAAAALSADPDADVRQGACRTVADSKDRAPELAEAMAALLDDTSRPVRVSAVHGLARHDDERCVEGARRLPPAPPGTSYEYDLDEVWRYERRRDGR